jgi:hypothetical protein
MNHSQKRNEPIFINWLDATDTSPRVLHRLPHPILHRNTTTTKLPSGGFGHGSGGFSTATTTTTAAEKKIETKK